MLSGSMAGLVNDPDIQNNTPAAIGKLAGAFAQLGMSTGKPRGWAAERLLEVKGLLNDNTMTPKQFVQNSIMQTKNGREALASSLDQFRQATEPVKTMEAERGPDGQETGRYVETMIPRHEYNRRMETRFGNPMSPVSAPSGGMGRQEQQPSAAPAAMGLPTGVPSGVTETQVAKSKQFSDLRADTSLQSKMATDSMMQIADMSGKLEKMGYNTGLFAPEQMNLAKAVMFFDPNNESGALDYVVSEKDPQKAAKVIGTMEAFDKQAILQKTEALRQAMGSAQKLTNTEFKTFQDALVGLRITPEGILSIYKYMEKLNKLVQERNAFLLEYEDLTKGTKHENDVAQFESQWFNYLKAHPEWYSFEKPKGKE